MSKILIAAVAAIVAGTSLWGWGWATRRVARHPPLPHALTVAVGLAVVLFLGGILNLLRLVSAGALDALVVIGLALTATGWLRAGRPRPPRPSPGMLLATIPVLVAGWFVAAHLLPQAAFNIYDDFEKYFSHPVIMLATGSLPPNLLGSMGGETLGGQAYLHAFVVAHFPLSFIGAADDFFCLLLCVTLAGFALKPGRWALGALVAQLCVLAINPQLVNISAVFSGAALLMAAIFLTALPAGSGRQEPSALVLGLLYAGTISLKSTYVPFVGLHFLAVIALGMWWGYRRLRWAMSVGLWTLLFVAPWVILHARLYLTAPQTTAWVLSGNPSKPLGLFSPATLAYGSTQLHYTGLALAGIVIAVLLLIAKRRGWLPASLPFAAAAAAGLAAGLTYFAVVVGCGLALFEPLTATRYCCPIMIAAIPALLRLLEPAGPDSRRPELLRFGPVVLGLVVVGTFLPSAAERIGAIAQEGVPLAYFARNTQQAKDDFVSYNREVLFGSVKSKIAAMQALVPVGEPLGAWVMAPFWFDFKRNPVFPAELAGLSMRWAQLPPKVNYFILEYNGFAVRPLDEYVGQMSAPGWCDRVVASRTLTFIAELKRRGGKGKTIYNDGSYVLMQFARP